MYACGGKGKRCGLRRRVITRQKIFEFGRSFLACMAPAQADARGRGEPLGDVVLKNRLAHPIVGTKRSAVIRMARHMQSMLVTKTAGGCSQLMCRPGFLWFVSWFVS